MRRRCGYCANQVERIPTRVTCGLPEEDRRRHRYACELKGEVDKILQAIDSGDIGNLREELGDLFLDLSRLCALAEEMGHFDVGDVLAGVVEKV